MYIILHNVWYTEKNLQLRPAKKYEDSQDFIDKKSCCLHVLFYFLLKTTLCAFEGQQELWLGHWAKLSSWWRTFSDAEQMLFLLHCNLQ